MESFMRTSSLLIASAALASAAWAFEAAPAAALDRQLGSVNVSADRYTPVTWSEFDGHVTRLSLVPENDSVDCTHITVNYENGDSYDVFDGTLPAGSTETITVPRGEDNQVSSVDFACKARHIDGARIALFSAAAAPGWADSDDDQPAHVRTFESADADY
jgi:hypothetical protein